MKEIMGIRVLDKEDLIDMYEMKKGMYNTGANIYLFDNDMRYPMIMVDGIEEYIEVTEVRDAGQTREYGMLKSGIFISIEDVKKFMDMSKIDKIAFYAKVVGDEKLEGFGILVGDIDDVDGETVQETVLFNKSIDTENNQFWFQYDRFNWFDVTFEQVKTFVTYGTILGEEKDNQEFFEK